MFRFDSPWQKDGRHPLEILESTCEPKSTKQNRDNMLRKPGFKRTLALDDMQNNRSRKQPWLRNNNETPATSSGFPIHMTTEYPELVKLTMVVAEQQ